MKYFFVQYTNDLPDGVGGAARGSFILIRPVFRNDLGILAHEKEHVLQWWMVLSILIFLATLIYAVFGHAAWPVVLVLTLISPVGHQILYGEVLPYRRWSEVCAYREQMRWPKGDGTQLTVADAAVRLASPRYSLGLSRVEASRLLTGES